MKKVFLLLFLSIFNVGISQAINYVVTSVADSGPGTLRQAIIDANASAGLDEIQFDLAQADCDAALVGDSGVCKIDVLTDLPIITDDIFIDGTTQPQYAAAPANVCATSSDPSYMRIELNGIPNNITYFTHENLSASTIKGLSLGSSNLGTSGHYGFKVRSSDNWIQCNHIGVNGPGDARIAISIGMTIGSGGASDGTFVGTNSDGIDDTAERNIIYADNLNITKNSGNDTTISGNYFSLSANGLDTFVQGTNFCFEFRQSNNLLFGSNLDGINDDLEKNILGDCVNGIVATPRLIDKNNVVAGNWIGLNANQQTIPMTNPVKFLIQGSTSGSYLFTQNWVNGGNIGLQIQDAYFMEPNSNNNCFTNNTVALDHQGEASDLDMSNNYWDAADGPSGIGAGSGGAINETGTGTVNYQPFLNSFPVDCYSGGIDYNLSVNVTGLLPGQQVAIQNGGDLLLATANELVTINSSLINGTAYDVSIFSQPQGQTCTLIGNNSGIISFADVELTLECKINVSVNLSGLAETNSVTFSNSGDTLEVTEDGIYQISALDDGANYFVFVSAHPDSPNQFCSFDSANSGNISAAPVIVDVSCQTVQYNLILDVEGLMFGSTLSFANEYNTIDIDQSGFNVLSTLDDGSSFNVFITAQPVSPNQICQFITPSSGVLAGQNLFIEVVCEFIQYDILVNVTGLESSNSVSFANGDDTLIVDANGEVLLSTQNDGSFYNVAITDQPNSPNQICDFNSSNNGVVSGANLQIDVSCVSNKKNIYLIVDGLAQSNNVSFVNGSDILYVDFNGVSLLSTLNEGTTYDIMVSVQPTAPNQTCQFIGSPTGVIGPFDDTFIEVNCVINNYFIGGTVFGLLDDNYLLIKNNGVDDKIITSNGVYIFDTPLLDQQIYNVQIDLPAENPIQPCVITNSSSTLNGSDVENVDIVCEPGIDLVYRNGFEENVPIP